MIDKISISDIIGSYIPEMNKCGFNIDWITRFKLVLTYLTQPDWMLCSYYFGEFSVYSDGKTLDILNHNKENNKDMTIKGLSINYDKTVRFIHYINSQNTLDITQSTTYEDSKPLVTHLTVYNSGAILGNPTYKLSNLSGKELSEKLMLIVEQGSISIYYNGDRINNTLNNYQVHCHYDGNGLINKVE